MTEADKNHMIIGKDTTVKTGGFRKIANVPEFGFCKHPEHDPPKHIVLDPGVYEYQCPACAARSVITQHRKY